MLQTQFSFLVFTAMQTALEINFKHQISLNGVGQIFKSTNLILLSQSKYSNELNLTYSNEITLNQIT